jgi:transposase InsO family protein
LELAPAGVGGPRRRDAGSQFTSVRYGERLAEIGAVPSIGSVGNSFDNALAETVNGYYKAELIRGPTRQQPWKTVEDVGLATLGWVTGTTPDAWTATSATSHQPSTSRRSTLQIGPTRSRSESHRTGLHQTPGAQRWVDGLGDAGRTSGEQRAGHVSGAAFSARRAAAGAAAWVGECSVR